MARQAWIHLFGWVGRQLMCRRMAAVLFIVIPFLRPRSICFAVAYPPSLAAHARRMGHGGDDGHVIV